MTDRPAPTPPASESDGGSVRVVGTAHVSADSVDEVEETIETDRPDVVAVELDESRYRQMKGELPDDLDASDLLRGNTVFQFLAYWMLSYAQTRLGDRFDIEPGADMRAAIETAESHDLGVALVDRDIQTTIQRFWARMTLPEKLKLIGGLAFGISDPRLVGTTGGLALGLFFGLLAALFVGPLFGFADLFTLGITGSVTLQLLGGVAIGAVVGLGVAASVVPPVVRVRRAVGSVGEFALRASGGLLVGVAIAGGIVATGTTIPLIGEGALAAVGDSVLRGTVGLAGGGAIGLAAGATVGIVMNALVADDDAMDEEFDIERLTDADVVTAMMTEFRRFSPGGAEALIDERDAYIAHKLITLRNEGYDVVAVVGAGHRQGIEAYLDNPEALPSLSSIAGTTRGPRFSVYKAVGYLVALVFLVFFVLLAMAGYRDGFFLRLFAAWFLFNGTFAFVMAKLAGAHWASAGVGGAIAWLTSINPLLAPGWFAGYVELRYTAVNVADIATLNEIMTDEESPVGDLLSRMLDVPLFKLIAVVAMTNVGSMVATFLFPVVVLPWLAADIGGVSAVGDRMIEGARNSAELIWRLVAYP